MPSPVDPSPSHPARLRVGVIGAGKVGVVLGAALPRSDQDLFQQFAPPCTDIHQIDPPRMTEPGIDLAKQFPDRRGVAWRYVHGGSEMTGRRLTPGVEPAGAVERDMHGLAPGHPHNAEPRPSRADLLPPRTFRTRPAARGGLAGKAPWIC